MNSNILDKAFPLDRKEQIVTQAVVYYLRELFVSESRRVIKESQRETLQFVKEQAVGVPELAETKSYF